MAQFITKNQFEEDELTFVPGRYADDIKVSLLFLSGAAFTASMLALIIDGWENSVFFLLQAIWLVLMYIAVEKR